METGLILSSKSTATLIEEHKNPPSPLTAIFDGRQNDIFSVFLKHCPNKTLQAVAEINKNTRKKAMPEVEKRTYGTPENKQVIIDGFKELERNKAGLQAAKTEKRLSYLGLIIPISVSLFVIGFIFLEMGLFGATKLSPIFLWKDFIGVGLGIGAVGGMFLGAGLYLRANRSFPRELTANIKRKVRTLSFALDGLVPVRKGKNIVGAKLTNHREARRNRAFII